MEVFVANRDLLVEKDDKPNWNLPDNRRWGFHNLPSVYRYGMSIRSGDVLVLDNEIIRRGEEILGLYPR